MTFLLDRLPRRMHLVIASRAEPPLALSRLRARGELTELRAADLRFTLDEASAFLRGHVARRCRRATPRSSSGARKAGSPDSSWPRSR